MSFSAGKIRVLIATTDGPVEVLLLVEEDRAIRRSIACVGGTTEIADIAAAYDAFVARPTGVIEARFGHRCYRLDVSAHVDAGSSWQLGVLVITATFAFTRLWDVPRSTSQSEGPVVASTSKAPGAPPASPPAAASPPSPAPAIPPPAAPAVQQSTRLDPERIPFVTTRDRQRIRAEYMPAPDYKALAASLLRMAFVSGQASQEAADRAAMEACEQAHGVAPPGASRLQLTERTCELYASGDIVVTHRLSPPMPPKPWINASVERPFAASEFPMIRPKLGDASKYPSFKRSKAIALSPKGFWYATIGQGSPDDAVRRSLERCGYHQRQACLLIAVDERFVTAAPTSARPIDFYGPDALSTARPDERAEMARRLASATEGWNAVALGAEGHLGITTGASSESAAVSGALDTCFAHDQGCRIAVIGPFLVEPYPANVDPSQQ